jgi:hypothetical protein
MKSGFENVEWEWTYRNEKKMRVKTKFKFKIWIWVCDLFTFPRATCLRKVPLVGTKFTCAFRSFNETLHFLYHTLISWKLLVKKNKEKKFIVEVERRWLNTRMNRMSWGASLGCSFLRLFFYHYGDKDCIYTTRNLLFCDGQKPSLSGKIRHKVKN